MTYGATDRTLGTPGRAGMYGLSLIELMVALLIGLLLMAGALTVYMQSRNTYRTTDTAARMQETARYAFDIIEPDVRLAGYWGMKKGPDAVTDSVAVAAVNPNCGAAGWIGDASRYIFGLDASWGGMPCAANSLNAASDVLVVRRASAETSALDATKVQVQSNRSQATVFKNAAAPSGYGAWPAAETRDMVVNVYYISTAGGQPALRRKRLIAGTPAQMFDEEVIPGIQDMQVQFGFDSTADGAADKYVNPGEVPAGGVIVSARIWLLVRSEADEQGYVNSTNYRYANADIAAANDKRRRVLIQKTIQIRNAQT
jgi:type IV pilus assembly protein PilW